MPVRSTIAAVLIAATAVASAQAADLPARAYTKAAAVDPAYNWSGFYVGINAGYGTGTSSTTLTPDAFEANILAAGLNINPLPPNLRPNGFVAGGQAGYNYQFGSVVAGVEADLSYAGLRKTDSATGPFSIAGVLTTQIATRLDWFGTVRARLGVLPASNLLLYATGGLAYGDVRTTTTGSNLPAINCTTFVYCATGSTSGVSVGWTAGGGMEYAFSREWTARAEYLYLDLGKRSVTFPDLDNVPGTLTAASSFRAHIVRGGLNYRF
jgi:outer membrane immunogenic protein